MLYMIIWFVIKTIDSFCSGLVRFPYPKKSISRKISFELSQRFKTMRLDNLKPDAVSYRTMIDVCAKVPENWRGDKTMCRDLYGSFRHSPRVYCSWASGIIWHHSSLKNRTRRFDSNIALRFALWFPKINERKEELPHPVVTEITWKTMDIFGCWNSNNSGISDRISEGNGAQGKPWGNPWKYLNS